MRHCVRLALVTVLSAGAVLGEARYASAQIVTVVPSVAVGTGFDDNVLWAPLGSPDVIWEVTPGFSMQRETPRSTWSGLYTFETDRYTSHPELTTALASQTANGQGQMKLTSQTTLLLTGAYLSSLTPIDLNVTTGLAVERIRASRLTGGPELTHAFTAATTADMTYQVTDDDLSAGDRVLTNAVDITLTHEWTGREAIVTKAIGRYYAFQSAGAVDHETSLGLLVGWREKLTPLTVLTILAGPRRDAMTEHPEIQVTCDHQAGASQFSAAYDRTTTTALGVTGLIRVQRVTMTAGTHLPGDLDATLAGGAFSNVFGGTTALVYSGSVEVAKHLKGAMTIAVSYSTDVQKGLLGLVGFVAAPPGSETGAVVLPAPPGQSVIRRNLILLRLTIAPDVKPRQQPPPNGGSASAGPGGV